MLHRFVFPVTIILAILLASCAGAGTPISPTPMVPSTASPAKQERFRSDAFHLEASLPTGWADAEGPALLARPDVEWVAFNS